MNLGAGSWDQVGQIPLSELAEVYEMLDQKNRVTQYNEALRQYLFMSAMGAQKLRKPDHRLYGVLK